MLKRASQYVSRKAAVGLFLPCDVYGHLDCTTWRSRRSSYATFETDQECSFRLRDDDGQIVRGKEDAFGYQLELRNRFLSCIITD